MNNSEEKKINYLGRVLLYIICALIIYIIFSYTRILFKHHINTYQVENGSLKISETYKGYIYREEKVIQCPKSGYCSYIYNNNSRVAKDSVIMCFTDIDYTKKNENVELNKKEVYNKIYKYNSSFDEKNFHSLYSYKNNIDNYINDKNNYVATYVDSKAYNDENSVKVYSKHSGILSYNVDGYENIKEENYSSDLLLSKDYFDTVYKSYYQVGENVGKIVTSPIYKILFESSSTLLDSYVNKKINIGLTGGEKIEAKLEKKIINDITVYEILVDKYLEEYINYRVIDFTILYKESFGMKIPNNCLFSRNCFAIEKDFVESSELDNNYYIYKLDENNNKKQCQIDVSYVDDKYYYVLYDKNNKILNINDKITYDGNVFTISIVKSFIGVFCINKGYKVFKIVDIFDKNTEYSIINKSYNTKLNEYDILLINVDI